MSFVCSKQHVQILGKVVQFAKDKPYEYCCIFVGSKIKSFHLAKELEQKLNSNLLTVDVIHVHKSLHKNENFWFNRIFCSYKTLQNTVLDIIHHLFSSSSLHI